MSVESEAVKLEDAPSQPQAETDVAAEQVEQVSKVEPQVEIAAQADAQAEVVVPEEATDPEKNNEDVEPSAKRVKLDPVQLGPKIFKDGQSLMLYHANLLRKMTLNQNFNEYESMVIKDLVMKGHQDPPSKIGSGIKGFQVRLHPEFQSRCLYILRTDGTMADFSYRKCCEKLWPLTTDELEAIGLNSGKDSRGKQAHGGGRGRGGGRGGGRGRGGRGRGGRGRR